MPLVQIHPSEDLVIDLAYATPHNFMGKPVYDEAHCFLHTKAAQALERTINLLRPLGLGIKIFDALRPAEAQWKLWEFCPNPNYVADPRRGSSHSRGIALDLNLIDRSGQELDMGTPFDDFTPLSHHGNTDISLEAQRNRFLFLGIMTAAGWDMYRYEWWHYQLFDAPSYPLWSDKDLPKRMMAQQAFSAA